MKNQEKNNIKDTFNFSEIHAIGRSYTSIMKFNDYQA